jgi:hypothetical protein
MGAFIADSILSRNFHDGIEDALDAMQNQNLDAHELVQIFQEHIRSGSEDGEVFCELGPLLRGVGKVQEARRCYKRAVEIMLAACRRGNADLALHLEQGIALRFVRALETEEHYYRCFSEWREDLAHLGRKFRDGKDLPGADARKVAFILMTGHRLGHTDVLLRYLSAYLETGIRRIEPTIYILDGYSEDFIAACTAVGAKVVALVRDQPAIEKAGIAQKLVLLRERLRADHVGCAVWVSVPAGSTFAFSMGLAPVQVFWALKFHPISGPYIDGYLTVGAPGQQYRKFGKQAWKVVPTPLAIEENRVDEQQIAEVRAQFAEPFLFGTIAREDKILSPVFLKAVSAILRANPGAGYLWTGRTRNQGIVRFLDSEGVGSRCHYVGWVNSPLYASAFDVFLETFPFGCGVTGYHALAAGTPLLSYLSEDTVFGMQYGHKVRSATAGKDLSQYPVLCAGTAEEYIELAAQLAADAEFRDKVGRRGREFFREQLALGGSHASEFFNAIEEIVESKFQQAALPAPVQARVPR